MLAELDVSVEGKQCANEHSNGEIGCVYHLRPKIREKERKQERTRIPRYPDTCTLHNLHGLVLQYVYLLYMGRLLVRQYNPEVKMRRRLLRLSTNPHRSPGNTQGKYGVAFLEVEKCPTCMHNLFLRGDVHTAVVVIFLRNFRHRG